VLFNQDQTSYRVEAHTMYCIAGCFSSEQNANRLSQKLDLLGFDCTILHEGGLYKVSLGQGISEQAINNINLKAKSLNIDTWILK
jgi:cell division protein FtsN